MPRKTKFIFEVQGLDKYLAKMRRLGESSNGVSKRALYEGAAVAAAKIVANIEALPYHPTKGISHKQKEGLLRGFGISKMKYFKKGKKKGYEVKLGFDGYNDVHTKKHPDGQPNALIAAAINSGTSRRKKTNFIYKAVNKKNRPEINAAMQRQFEEDTKKLMDKPV